MKDFNMKKDTKITYFFQGGRKSRLNNNEEYAKEMFYGFDYFKSKYPDTEIIEFSEHKTKLRRLFFIFVEKPLRNLLKLPLYWTFLTSQLNYKRIKESNILVFSNNRMACSVLPMLLVAKKTNKNINSLCFVMGLFSRMPKYKFLHFFQKGYIKLLLSTLDNFIFLSQSEMNEAIARFPKFEYKFLARPFAVDQNIWNKGTDKKDDYILFVGNDGFRNYELAENLTKKLPDINFVFVSELIEEDKLQKSNYKLIKGSWGMPGISDLELRDLYRNAKVTIVPLINSLQPSGQSVTLQSMSCGTPVIISKTEGFWDKERFIDKENIIFIEDNSLDNWVKTLNEFFALDKNEYNSLIKEGIELIKKNYQLDKYNIEIENILIRR